MMKKASWLEIALATALMGLAALFTCTPRQALASPMGMLRSMVSGITLHTWGTGDVLRATDLNGNFTALNNGKVGGGVQLVNADVSNSAAIAHSKLAFPALLPKAWATLNGTACLGGDASDTTTCTLADSSQVTSIKSSGTAGQYRVTLAYTPANANFGVQVTSHTASIYCIAIPTTGTAFSTTAPQFQVACRTDGNVQTNANFTLTVYDT